MAQQQNPKCLINQFFQRAKVGLPCYKVEPAPAEQCFVCTLTLPAVTVEGETLPGQVYKEKGPSKKLAQDAAAAAAFKFLSEQTIYGSLKSYDESLLRTLATRVLSPQGLFRDPEIHGAAAAAVAYLGGELPLAALTHSRFIRSWAKEYGKSYGEDLAMDPLTLIDVVRRELLAQAQVAVVPEEEAEVVKGATAEASSKVKDPATVVANTAAVGAAAGAAASLGLNLGPSGLSVRLSAEAVDVSPPAIISEEVDQEVVEAGGMATLVVIPSDSSLPLREESIPASGSLLVRVAELLACPSPHHVLQWGRVGHKATVVTDLRVAIATAAAREAAATAAAVDAPLEGGLGSTELAEPFASLASVAASVGGACGGGVEEMDVESEAASAPPPPPPPQLAPPPRPRPCRLPASAATACASPTTSAQSICPPPVATFGEEFPADSSLLEPPVSTTEAIDSGATAQPEAGGGSAADDSGAPVVLMSLAAPHTSPHLYRAESTVSLVVHRGPAAMDWDPDGQTEVRGPEHLAPPAGPTPSGGMGGRGRRFSSSGGRTPQAHGGGSRQSPNRLGGSGAAPAQPNRTAFVVPLLPGGTSSSIPLSLLASKQVDSTPGAADLGGRGSGTTSPRHANIHLSLTSTPSPSLYSKLLLPPLPLRPSPSDVAAAARSGEPPLLSLQRSIDGGGSEGGRSIITIVRSMSGEPLNVRATWLAGRPVYGDAIATTCRQNPTPHLCKNHHVMKWRNYRAVDAWRTATAATPAAAYTRSCQSSLLLRGLPSEYRGPASWVGPPPRQLLDAYVASHALTASSYSQEFVIPDVDLPGEGLAELKGTNFLGMPYKFKAGPGTLDVASQQVALAALFKLQRLDAACLKGTVTLEQLTVPEPALPPPPPQPAAGATPHTEAPGAVAVVDEAAVVDAAAASVPQDIGLQVEVQVVNPGLAHARQPQDGCLVKIAYTISLPTEGKEEVGGTGAEGERGGEVAHPGAINRLVLEQHPGLTVAVGAASAPGLPEVVDRAVRQLRVGGSAKFRLPVSLDGCDPLGVGFPLLDCEVELRLLSATLPLVEGRAGVAGGRGSQPLFTPPLGQKRMETVVVELLREGVKSVVDLGCGECKLMECLLRGHHGDVTGGSLVRMVGVDISRSALVAGGKKLSKMTAAAQEVADLMGRGENSVIRPVEVTLYRGSGMSPRLAGLGAEGERAANGVPTVASLSDSTDPWVTLRGCDAVSMVEVVEHLDPEPLRLVGPCVLGGIRPRLLLVTTPNWEYNAVLRGAERATAAAAAAKGLHGKAAASGTRPPVPPASHWPGPPGRDGLPLRCSDHRFEWNREEFQNWARGLAAEYGYAVKFQGIGRVNNEAAALQMAGCESSAHPGEATQMAIFKRCGKELNPGCQRYEESGVMERGAASCTEGEQRSPAAVVAAAGDIGGGEGSGDDKWELVWGPALVAVPPEEVEVEVAVEEVVEMRRGSSDGGSARGVGRPTVQPGVGGRMLPAGAVSGVKRSSEILAAASEGAVDLAAAGSRGNYTGHPNGEVDAEGVGRSGLPAKRRMIEAESGIRVVEGGVAAVPDVHTDPPGVDPF